MAAIKEDNETVNKLNAGCKDQETGENNHGKGLGICTHPKVGKERRFSTYLAIQAMKLSIPCTSVRIHEILFLSLARSRATFWVTANTRSGMKCYAIIFFLVAALNFTCDEGKIRNEGFVNVKGGRIWYQIAGAEKKGIPVLLLHAGPGFPSDYLKPLQALAADRPVIFYDQLGCGRSGKPLDTSVWNIKRFSEEISTLRIALALDSIHLFAHSWGTMLAAEYLSSQPNGIKSIIFSGPILSTQKHLDAVNNMKYNLPSFVRDTLLFHESNGTIFSESYVKAYNEYMRLYWCRVYPYPEEIEKSFLHFGVKTFETMWGHYEFFCPGNLKSFDRTNVLDEIKVPTLFACGRYDITSPEITGAYETRTAGAELVIFGEKCTHAYERRNRFVY